MTLSEYRRQRTAYWRLAYNTTAPFDGGFEREVIEREVDRDVAAAEAAGKVWDPEPELEAQMHAMADAVLGGQAPEIRAWIHDGIRRACSVRISPDFAGFGQSVGKSGAATSAPTAAELNAHQNLPALIDELQNVREDLEKARTERDALLLRVNGAERIANKAHGAAGLPLVEAVQRLAEDTARLARAGKL